MLENPKHLFQNSQLLPYQVHLLDKVKQYMAQYLMGMFTQLSQLFNKKLNAQMQKIKRHQKFIRIFTEQEQKARLQSRTSLDQIQLNSLGIKNNYHLDLAGINNAIQKMQESISKLNTFSSLTSFHNMRQDYQPNQEAKSIENKKLLSHDNHSGQQFWKETTNNISKLNIQIYKIAKQKTQLLENEQVTHQQRKFRPLKSKSLISISNRRYFPLSCPQLLEYGQPSQRYNANKFRLNNTDSNLNVSENNKLQSNFSKNKMPLINETKSTINKLFEYIKDQEDSKLVKFYLKKALLQIQKPLYGYNESRSKQGPSSIFKKGFIRKNSQAHPKKQLVPEYFENKNKRWQTSNNDQSQNKVSQCSIAKHTHQKPILKNQNSISTFAQNQQSRKQNVFDSFLNNQSNISKQNRKHFQRTSNQHKIMVLKKKFLSPSHKF